MTNTPRTVDLSTATISFLPEGYIHLHYKSHTFSLTDNVEIFNVTRRHSPWDVCPFLVSFDDFSGQDKASKLFNSSTAVIKCSNAYAFVTKNIAQKLEVTSFIKMVEPVVPCRLFSEEKPAIDWLLTFTWSNESKT